MAETYKLFFKNGIVVTVENVASETTTDDTVYDLTNYRDLFDATTAGGTIDGWAPSVGEPFKIARDPANAPTGALSDAIIHTSDLTEDYHSLPDNISHIVPRNEAKKRSKIKLWSGAGGTGTLLYSAWSDRLDSWGVAVSFEVL